LIVSFPDGTPPAECDGSGGPKTPLPHAPTKAAAAAAAALFARNARLFKQFSHDMRLLRQT
jgi:hypothetical protein